MAEIIHPVTRISGYAPQFEWPIGVQDPQRPLRLPYTIPPINTLKFPDDRPNEQNGFLPPYIPDPAAVGQVEYLHVEGDRVAHKGFFRIKTPQLIWKTTQAPMPLAPAYGIVPPYINPQQFGVYSTFPFDPIYGYHIHAQPAGCGHPLVPPHQHFNIYDIRNEYDYSLHTVCNWTLLPYDPCTGLPHSIEYMSTIRFFARTCFFELPADPQIRRAHFLAEQQYRLDYAGLGNPNSQGARDAEMSRQIYETNMRIRYMLRSSLAADRRARYRHYRMNRRHRNKH